MACHDTSVHVRPGQMTLAPKVACLDYTIYRPSTSTQLGGWVCKGCLLPTFVTRARLFLMIDHMCNKFER